MAIPLGKVLTEDVLYELAKTLLAQVTVDGRAWPCANLSLSVGGFEDGVTNNKGIGSFLLRGDEAKAMQTSALSREDSTEDARTETPPPSKKRKVEGGISGFFASYRAPNATSDNINSDDSGALHDSPHEDHADQAHEDEDPMAAPPSAQPVRDSVTPEAAPSGAENEHEQLDEDTYVCARCAEHVSRIAKEEHDDFHFAQDLQNQQSSPLRPPPKPIPPAKPSAIQRPRGRGRPPLSAGTAEAEKGQKRLAFG